MTLKQWLYRGGRPNVVARALNRAWAGIHALGIAPNYLVTLEVRGRRSGRPIRLPLVMTVLGGQRYLVSMLGEDVDWVRNVRAARGSAVLQHGRREPVLLEDVVVEQRPAILQAYLRCAPGARGHLPIDQHAPVAEFRRIAPRFPVFRVLPAPAAS